MFEAHYNQADDFQGIDTLDTKPNSWTKTYYRRHKLSAQPLKIWFARGKRQKHDGGCEQRIFAYIEYEDSKAKQQNRHLELAATVSVTEALRQAVQVDLGVH